MKRRLFVLALGSLMAATAAYAHHSFARDYHEDQMISLEGDVVSFDYRNPHAWVYFTANDSGGVMVSLTSTPYTWSSWSKSSYARVYAV